MTDEERAAEQSYYDQAYLYWMNFQNELMAICVKACRDTEYAEELMHDVVLARLPRVIELWDRRKPLRNYVNNTMRWYVLKHIIKLKKSLKRESTSLSEWFHSESVAFDETEETVIRSNQNAAKSLLGYTDSTLHQVDTDDAVEKLLSSLDDYEKQLVLLYVVHGYSYSQLGDMAGITRVRASKIVNAALDKIRNGL